MTIFLKDRIYRGVSVETERWVFGSLVQTYAGDTDEEEKYFIVPNDPYSLMQIDGEKWICRAFEIKRETLGTCSGRTDIDGEMIYAGDILERSSFDDPEAKPERFLVVDLDGKFAGDGTSFIYEEELETCRIIGNAFDDPELGREVAEMSTVRKLMEGEEE